MRYPSQHTQSENLEREETSQIVQCVYWDSSDVWGGEMVKVDISYDTSNNYLLKAYIQVIQLCRTRDNDVLSPLSPPPVHE